MTQKDLFSLASYQYDLPKELIAQSPCQPRDHSRLMVVNRKTGEILCTHFREILNLLRKGEGLIFNDTKVIPARLFGTLKTGGSIEILLAKKNAEKIWEVLAKPGRKLKPGTWIRFSEKLSAEVLEVLPDGKRRLQFDTEENFHDCLEECGELPIPPYIQRKSTKEDLKNYQTVFASKSGAVAAPTAGLHFTQELLESLKAKGILETKITLHVGLGTFLPVQTDDIRAHKMHEEWCEISEEASHRLNQAKKEGHRQICVGTTCCRTLESATGINGLIEAGEFNTDIFIYPGYTFKYVDALLTNFHLPGSTLLMLVSAFGGYELMMEAYKIAVQEQFRFFSYGDAMLIL